MASAKALSAILFTSGVVIGTLLDRAPVRVPLRIDGYSILAGDFHVHAFPGDGALGPWALRDEARRAGLDVFALTNHNQTVAARLARWAAGLTGGPIVIVGEEITNPDYHLIAVGIEHPVRADQPAAGAIADVHAQGGVAIAAHPTKAFHGWEAPAMMALDGTEAAHPIVHESADFRSNLEEFFERARELNPRVAPIGSSDTHATPTLGECRTYVFVREVSAAGVLDAIRNGRTVASDRDGRYSGSPEFIRLLEQGTPAGRADGSPVWRRASLLLAWIGVLGMLLSSGSR
jgi:predicted metal-dependent phosphoesterase TrpH